MLNMSWSGGFEFKNFNCSKQLLFVHAKFMGWCINHVVLVGFDKWYSASHNRNKKILFSSPICNNIYIYIYIAREMYLDPLLNALGVSWLNREQHPVSSSLISCKIYIYIYIYSHPFTLQIPIKNERVQVWQKLFLFYYLFIIITK